MTERSIILRDRDVRAVLAGTKTQHRVPVNMRHVDFIGGSSDDRNDPRNWGFADECGCWHVLDQTAEPWRGDGVTCEAYAITPPYRVGDTLWVREAFADCWMTTEPVRPYYRADFTYIGWRAWGFTDVARGTERIDRWRSSTHMKRNQSRLTLRVTDVRVQRLSDVAEEDVVAMGYVADPEQDMSAHDFWFVDDSRFSMQAWADDAWVWALTWEIVR